MKENILKTKSYAFALNVIKLYQKLSSEKKEFVLSKQILRSGTSIGANIEEANQAESKRDFIHKLGIAQKEANETHYWIRLLTDSNYIVQSVSIILKDDCEELIKLITSSIKTAKNNLDNA
ncbi:MAG: four helix bundle protein [Bacteroidales bacterium]|nr:four helix bundle protein [Bacteroidales bacterium]MBK8882102.1 four helix bundle protein [Bacteroidales bacterium]